jgi:hypothetical protein
VPIARAPTTPLQPRSYDERWVPDPPQLLLSAPYALLAVKGDVEYDNNLITGWKAEPLVRRADPLVELARSSGSADRRTTSWPARGR